MRVLKPATESVQSMQTPVASAASTVADVPVKSGAVQSKVKQLSDWDVEDVLLLTLADD
jgi:hypothetical protein